MTVQEGLRAWLRGHDSELEEITLDRLQASPDALGLFRTPEAQVTRFVDGTRDVTAFYDFFFRAPCQTDGLRAGGMERVEALERWVLTQSMARELPELGDGRDCYGVFVSGGGSLIEQTDSESVYHLQIGVQYFEEG